MTTIMTSEYFTKKTQSSELCKVKFSSEKKNRVGGAEDFDDDADDDNIDDQDEDVAFEIIPAGQSGGSVAKNKRITTKYMTKLVFV